ncbi:hypothetical protein [Serratia rubidaea]|nr:hypothetical protein [Serratia rubidaea]
MQHSLLQRIWLKPWFVSGVYSLIALSVIVFWSLVFGFIFTL